MLSASYFLVKSGACYFSHVKMILKLLCWVMFGISITSSSSPDEYDLPRAYPTNFFKEMVPKFVNSRPIVGIVGMQVYDMKMLKLDIPFALGKDFFGSSFVKLVQTAGARTVPVLEDITKLDLERLLQKLNGFILPGGDADIAGSGYERISKQVIEFSKKQAKKGIKFPVLGICRGAQIIMIAEANKDFLVETDSLNLSIPLRFTADRKHSRLFGHASKGLISRLSNHAMTFNAHKMGIPTEGFYNNSYLMKRFRVISTNFDRNGTEFISTFEGIHAPLYGLQWHPEKVLCVFNPELAADHSIYSIISGQYIANFFIGEARMNPFSFSSRIEEEDHILASKDPPIYVGNSTDTPYEQIYVFDIKPEHKPPKKIFYEDNSENRIE